MHLYFFQQKFLKLTLVQGNIFGFHSNEQPLIDLRDLWTNPIFALLVAHAQATEKIYKFIFQQKLKYFDDKDEQWYPLSLLKLKVYSVACNAVHKNAKT